MAALPSLQIWLFWTKYLKAIFKTSIVIKSLTKIVVSRQPGQEHYSEDICWLRQCNGGCLKGLRDGHHWECPWQPSKCQWQDGLWPFFQTRHGWLRGYVVTIRKHVIKLLYPHMVTWLRHLDTYFRRVSCSNKVPWLPGYVVTGRNHVTT